MSAIYVDKKVWPTPDNSQHSNDATVPLRQLLAYWQSLLKAMPADEAESCTVRNFGAVEIWKQYRRSEVEIRDAQRATLLQALTVAIGDGTITPDELQAAIARSADA